MASHPPSACCTVGVKHEGAAAGEIRNVADVSAYISVPPEGKSSDAILLLTDVFGHRSINPQLIADQFAANGYTVIMPDLFDGDPVPFSNRAPDFDLMRWIASSGPQHGHTPRQVDPIVARIIGEMRTSMAIQRIAAVGFCFGAKYVARFMAPGKGIDVGCMAHPSFVDLEELGGIAGPLDIAAAETDDIFTTEKRRQTEDILSVMKVPYRITLYSDVEHGFATRADLSNRNARFAKEAVFLQQLAWIDHHLRGVAVS